MVDDGPFGANPNVGVGFSDKALLVVSVAGFCMLAATVYAVVIARVKTRQEIQDDDEDEDYDEKLTRADVSKLSRAQRRARARAIMKKERRVTPATVPIRPEGGEGHEQQQQQQGEEMDPDDQPPHTPPVQNHLSRKERQRAAKAAEKENRRLFEEERRKQQLETQQQLQKEKRERERAEAQKAQEDRRQKVLEKQAQEQKEREEWKSFLSCPDRTLLVNDWIEELGETRNFDMEKAAARFSTSFDTVRTRIEKLVQEGRVGGVVEGTHFIFLSDDELKTISDQILQAGSFGLSDVAHICNQTLSSSRNV